MKILKPLLFIGLVISLFNCKKERLNDKSLANYQVTISSELTESLRAVLVTDSEGNIYEERIVSPTETNDISISCMAPDAEPVHVTLIELENPQDFTSDFLANTYFDTKSGADFSGNTEIEQRPFINLDVTIIGIDSPNPISLQIGNGRKSFYKIELADSVFQFKDVPFLSEESQMFILKIDGEAFYFVPPVIFMNSPIIPFSNFKKIVYNHTIEDIETSIFNWDFTPGISFFAGTDDRNGRTFPIYSDWNRATSEISLFIPDEISLSNKYGFLDYGGLKIIDLDSFPSRISFNCWESNFDKSQTYLGSLFEFSDPTFSSNTKYFKEKRSFPTSNNSQSIWNLQGLYIEDYYVAIPKISENITQHIESLETLASIRNFVFSNTSLSNIIIADRIVNPFNETDLIRNPLLINDLEWIRKQKIELCQR